MQVVGSIGPASICGADAGLDSLFGPSGGSKGMKFSQLPWPLPSLLELARFLKASVM